MPTPTADELSRGVQFARSREAARLSYWRRQADRTTGVYYSGLSVGPFTPQTEAMIQAEGRQWAEMWARKREEEEAAFAAEVSSILSQSPPPTDGLDAIASDLRAAREQGEAA